MADRQLDPEMAAVLATLAGMTPMEQMPLDQLRASMAPLAPELRTPMARVEDLSISGLVPMRLYVPVRIAQDFLIVFFHGGGFVLGSIETHDHVARDLAQATGCRVVSADYRLAPEHKFPAAAQDCLTVSQWALGGGAASLDCTSVILAGDSAGGNLAAVTAIQLRDAGGLCPVGLILAYPVTDFHTPPRPSYLENASGYSLTRAAMQRFWSDYLEDENDATNPLAAPVRHPRLFDLPPTLLLTAEFDPLRDEGSDYARLLSDAGGRVTHIDYPGLIHGFLRMGIVSGRARSAYQDIGRWVDALDPG